jgi:V/A-type H+-transporting ATPase subunit A
MREISSRMEEMPGEEGFPAYLSARLSDFYERAGKVDTLSGKSGSITVIGAVSPSGGDLSEPVTQNTLRITKTLWALDSKLRERRHFPAINWLTSYSLYTEQLDKWYMEKIDRDFPEARRWALTTLKKEAELQEIVQLVGSDALPVEQQLLIDIASMLREFFLQQSAFHQVDTYSPMPRQFTFLSQIRKFADLSERAVAKGVSLEKISSLRCRNTLAKLKFDSNIDAELSSLGEQMEKEFSELEA